MSAAVDRRAQRFCEHSSSRVTKSPIPLTTHLCELSRAPGGATEKKADHRPGPFGSWRRRVRLRELGAEWEAPTLALSSTLTLFHRRRAPAGMPPSSRNPREPSVSPMARAPCPALVRLGSSIHHLGPRPLMRAPCTHERAATPSWGRPPGVSANSSCEGAHHQLGPFGEPFRLSKVEMSFPPPEATVPALGTPNASRGAVSPRRRAILHPAGIAAPTSRPHAHERRRPTDARAHSNLPTTQHTACHLPARELTHG